ncbi:MAG: hypothetical protein ACXWBO_16145 [Ilumatobacteraceae bacterium]
MTALASRRRRNTLIALAAGLLAAVAAPTLVYVGAKAISNSKAGRNVLANVTPEQAFPKTPTAMLATVSDTNELTSVTVLVLAPDADVSAPGYDQRGGSIVSVPINADTESSDQAVSLHDAYAQGGADGLRVGLESATNLSIDFTAVMKRDEFATFLTGFPSLSIDLPRDVLGPNDAVLFPKGATTLKPAQIAEIMTTKSPTEHERLRRTNLEALWAGISAAIGSGRQGLTLSAAAPTTFAELANRLMAGTVASRGLLTRAVDVAQNPDKLDVEELDKPDTVLVFASIAPASMSRPGGGLSYRVEAPPGYDAQVRKTIAILLAADGNVVSVDLRAKPQAKTTLSIYDKEMAAVEPTSNTVFGSVTVQTPDVRLAGVDETITLGTDYLKHVDLSVPDATSTSVQPTETTG